jgi:hypothetical protein
MNTAAHKGKQLLLLKRYPPCYSYIQFIPVKLLVVIEERKNYIKVKDQLSFEIWIILKGNQIVTTTVEFL